jgi:nicotinamide mononucleotide transporter
MAMAFYGWRQWRYGGSDHTGVSIRTLTANQHAAIMCGIAVLTFVSGYLLSHNTGAAWPYVDSFTTWASVITTVLVAKKYLENWIYWFVIDAVSIPLYLERGLQLTAWLFGVYLVIVVVGYVTWQRHWQAQNVRPAHA